jgi:hypothetical protein
MPANPSWARWVYASCSTYLKAVADANQLPALIEGIDDRTTSFMEQSERIEIRVNGPYTQELSHGYYRLWTDVNVLLTSRFDRPWKNRHVFLNHAGLFHEAMDQPIHVYRYGSQPGDDGSYVGCLHPRPEPGESVRVLHFGQIDATDRIRQSAVDARYVMYLTD